MERHFAEELKTLKQKLFQMGLLVENALEKSFEALIERSEDRVKAVFEDEKVINSLEIEIDESGHTLLALVQPMARDLRLITMILKINTDLERMGDHAVNIAEKSQYLISQPPLSMDFPLESMAEAVKKMEERHAGLECRCVGDAGVTRTGWASSRSCSSRIRRSYWASDTTG